MDSTTNPTTNPRGLSRRALLVNGGAALGAGALLAACGGSSTHSVARLGDAPETQPLEDEKVTDVVLLRTAMSVEKMAHEALTSSTLATGAVAGLMRDLAVGHENALGTLAAAVTARGGEPVTTANAKLRANWGDHALELVAESDKKEADAAALAHALQTLLASTYQYFVPQTTEPALRADMMRLGAAASRRAAVIALQINPGTKGFVPTVDDKGVASVAALPSAFGTQAGIHVMLGKADEAGLREDVTLETPSLNSYVW